MGRWHYCVSLEESSFHALEERMLRERETGSTFRGSWASGACSFYDFLAEQYAPVGLVFLLASYHGLAIHLKGDSMENAELIEYAQRWAGEFTLTMGGKTIFEKEPDFVPPKFGLQVYESWRQWVSRWANRYLLPAHRNYTFEDFDRMFERFDTKDLQFRAVRTHGETCSELFAQGIIPIQWIAEMAGHQDCTVFLECHASIYADVSTWYRRCGRVRPEAQLFLNGQRVGGTDERWFLGVGMGWLASPERKAPQCVYFEDLEQHKQ